MSGVGKGIATASIGKIIQSKGFNVTAIKIDPYINVDAGTMNPTEHGEVFVTEDADETDQDIGNYERFLDIDILRDNYMTTGRVYKTVIEKERNLEYGGKCVEVVPHIPEEVIRRIKKAGQLAKADVCIIEIGGTIGEYQNILFLEAARMLHLREPNNVAFVLVSYLPVPFNIGEMKTKPTQYAVRSLNSAGIQPDFILCRASIPLDDPRKNKIATFCNIDKGNVISAPDIESIYEVPLNFEKDELADKILKKLKLKAKKRDLSDWKKMMERIKNSKDEVKIGIVGKYFSTGEFVLSDAYISVIEAIKHAAWSLEKKPVLEWINAEKFEKDKNLLKELDNLDGIVVPGGFGSRGIQGKINVIEYARIHKIPYFGLCYGMQLACIEFARNVCGIKNATSEEINPKGKLIIHIMAEQAELLKKNNYGNSMRLGAYPCILQKGTISERAYGGKKGGGENIVNERHRHRYEFNNNFCEVMQKNGLIIAGLSPSGDLVEIIELLVKEHPFFVGVQFHPEFKSRPLRPHPLFKEFIRIAASR